MRNSALKKTLLVSVFVAIVITLWMSGLLREVTPVVH